VCKRQIILNIHYLPLMAEAFNHPRKDSRIVSGVWKKSRQEDQRPQAA
jgi:hypothetical protein